MNELYLIDGMLEESDVFVGGLPRQPRSPRAPTPPAESTP